MGGCRADHDAPSHITYLGFNQDQTCLAVGTWCGFTIFSTDGLALLHQEACGAVSLVEMLFRTSLVALVGAGSAGSGQLTMWNTKERRNICQLQFNATIHAAKMNHRRIVVLLKQKIHIFDLKTMRSLHVIDRSSSPWADPSIGWLCAAHERGYLATPLALAVGTAAVTFSCNTQAAGVQGHATTGGSYGSPRVYGGDGSVQSGGGPLGTDTGEARLGLVSVVDTHTLKPIGTVLAHRSPVQALCLNPTGQLLATASTKGTVIRLFAVPALDLLYAFRRGASACRIFGLLFSRDSSYVCASASSGTVHIFKNSDHMLGALPLETEESTVGAAHREMISHRSTGAPDPAPTKPQLATADARPLTHEDAHLETDDLSEWNVVAERPERQLELDLGLDKGPSGSWTDGGGGMTGASPLLQLGGSVSSRKKALQTLSAVSEYAAENTAKHAKHYAKSLLQLLPQPCRELVDAPRAFAWVHLQDDEEAKLGDHRGVIGGGARGALDSGVLPKLPAPFAEGLRFAMLGTSQESTSVHVGGYVACVTSGLRAGRAEVLVATIQGCAHSYDWSVSTGGECRLRAEHAFMGRRVVGGASLSGAAIPPSSPADDTCWTRDTAYVEDKDGGRPHEPPRTRSDVART
eukprot:TRINITY_DN70422_c0_g1_i1.p1 TRINITY_DN70422_c0_g1~~TRINITY_DN70422_c0_g1_i1.p1  ORF type:complete len:646 (-),score=79.04 TRINITY_DN70422_c0_g1_i1:464-2368(-)